MTKINAVNRQKKLKKIIVSYVLLMILIVFMTSIIFNLSFTNTDIIVFAAFSLISIVSLYMLIRETYRRSFSIVMLHWFFFNFLWSSGLCSICRK